MTETLLINARVVTLAGPAPRRGDAMRDTRVIDPGFVHFRNDRIIAAGPGTPDAAPRTNKNIMVIDAVGRVVMPAFVDCHTHACWVGDRYDEFEMKLRGAQYLDILKAGGGIMSTVRAVRNASVEELAESLSRRLASMIDTGSAVIEVKTGYGLNRDAEIAMLRAIQKVRHNSPFTIIPTFLGAHAIDPANPRFIEETIEETLPAIAKLEPGICCDAYCEQGAWTVADTVRYLEKARSLNLPIRVHADQFHCLGMTREAIELGARSVDHLEASSDEDLRALAESDAVGVMLPACAFHMGGAYAPARRFIDMNGALALATNYNPGSAPTPSIPFIIALAMRGMHLSIAEALCAVTINAACALGLAHETGSIEPGKRADLQMLDASDERDLAFTIAGRGPRLVWAGGRIIVDRR